MAGGFTKIWQTATNMLGASTVPVSGTWDSRIVSDVLSRMPSPVRTVIDVGSHTGEFAMAAGNALPDAHVLCFEPLAACQPLLRKNAARLKHCEVFDCALGDANEMTIMHCNAFTPCSSLLPMLPLHTRAFPQSFSARTERVKVRRLDDVLRNTCQLAPRILLLLVADIERSPERDVDRLVLRAQLKAIRLGDRNEINGRVLPTVRNYQRVLVVNGSTVIRHMIWFEDDSPATECAGYLNSQSVVLFIFDVLLNLLHFGLKLRSQAISAGDLDCKLE
ncbi:MAG TPA: FkbM family methyltransferase [Candidatus Peribacteria bacterium]|nr:FkbM family methyltransferase [Candidatus Peribacteria bacterium]